MLNKIKKIGLIALSLFAVSCGGDIGVTTQYVEEIAIYGEPIVQTGTVYDQAVDILFVVDESGSMFDDWETLARTMPDIYEILVGPEFIDLRWRVGIASTDPSGDIYGWVDYDDPQALLKLMSLTSLLQNHYKEAGLDSAIQVVTWDESGFERPNADLLFVFISDEPDQSIISPTDYDLMMDLVKESPFEVSESAIVATYEGARCDSAELGEGYLDVAETIVDLCDSDWKSVLDRPKDHLPTLNERWHLDYTPLDSSLIKVFVSENGEEASEYSHWQYDDSMNAVILTKIPEAGSFVTIVYTI